MNLKREFDDSQVRMEDTVGEYGVVLLFNKEAMREMEKKERGETKKTVPSNQHLPTHTVYLHITIHHL